jgi:hypothetical protein
MLYIEHMNLTIDLHVSVEMTIRFFAPAFILVAFAALKIDLASSALLPSGAGFEVLAQTGEAVKSECDGSGGINHNPL